MSSTRFLLSLFILVLGTTNTWAQGFLRSQGKKIVNDSGEFIPRGFGLGGWMLQEPYMLKLGGISVAQYDIKNKVKDLVGESNTKTFYEAWLLNHCTKADIDSIAAWGFNSVRLPMHYNLYTLPVESENKAGSNTWLTKGFELTDSLLNWCRSNRIYLILDLHAAPGGQGNDIAISDRDSSKPSLWQSEPNKQKTIAFWKKMAARYSNEPWIGGYDILNEPNWGFQDMADKNGCNEKDNAALKQLYKEITAAIREADKNHIIIIEGNCWGNNYNGIFPLWDNNMVLSFHKYWNLNETASIQYMLDYREKYNVPIWLGETGENSNAWLTEMVALMEENKIGWNIWPLKKSGLNNPFQVKINTGYQEIINYWNGKAPKPDPQKAMASLMEFAANTNIRNTIFHHGVVDAITRQVKNEQALPFKKNLLAPNSIIFAADYDLGRSGYVYHDKDSADYWVSTKTKVKWNEGGQYRNDGVDIENCADPNGNGYSIGWINDGEWLQYSLYTPSDVVYDISLRTAATSGDGKVRLLVNDHFASEVMAIPYTGDLKNWQNTSFRSVRFTKGWNNLRVLAVKGGFNFNYIQVLASDGQAKVN